MAAAAYRRPSENSSTAREPKQAPTSADAPNSPEPAAATKATPRGARSPKTTAPASTAASRRWMPASASTANGDGAGVRTGWAISGWVRRALILL